MTKAEKAASRAPLLKPFEGQKPPAPAWFEQALAAQTERGTSTVGGATIHWKAWGERGKPGLILVHGGVAHKDWWDSIAPFLAETRRIVALDLSGMGDSDHRNAYTMDLYVEEVLTAGEAGGAFEAGKPFVVGHSFGGFVSLTTAVQQGERLRGIAVMDSPIRPPEEQRNSSPPSRGGRIYDSIEEAMMRFRLLPEQRCDNLFLIDHIARQSLHQVERPDGTLGWTWKFDVDLWKKLTYSRLPPAELVAALKCRVALFRGGDSKLVTDEVWAYMRSIFGEDTSMISVPAAEHHLILDQPIAVATALETLTGPGWGV